jgi:hypothetical protein
MASAQDSLPGCPWGAAYDPIVDGYVSACFNAPAATESSAPKAAGLAASAQVEQHDPTMDWISGQERNANAVALVVAPAQGLPCLYWGGGYDPMTGFVQDCLSRPANAAAPKPAGLAKLAPAPQAQFGPCGFGEHPDAILLACLTPSVPTVSAATKPAGLAAPAQVVQHDPTMDWILGQERNANAVALVVAPAQGLPCLSWGGGYDPMTGFVQECLSQPAANAAAAKPAGLAKPAPAPAQQQLGPCGASGESPDPLLLVCLR